MNPEILGAFTEAGYYDDLARLRREDPVREYAPSSWTVARYDDVRAVSRDPERFSSAHGVLMNDPMRHGQKIDGSVLHMDPPEHAAWRALVTRRFTPRAVGLLEDRVRAVARSVLAAVPTGEEIDFVDAVAAPFPVLVIAELLGIANADREQFRRWSDSVIDSPDRPGENLADLGALFQFLVDLVEARRADPTDDIASAVVHAEVQGEPVTTREAVGCVLALLVAGNETTRHLVSGSAYALAEHPGQRALLARAGPHRQRGRGMPALGHTDPGLRPHRDAGHGNARTADRGGRLRRPAVRVGEPRREHVRPEGRCVRRDPPARLATRRVRIR